MKKSLQFAVSVFFALGAMISFSPREDRRGEESLQPDTGTTSPAKYFAAAWEHLSSAVMLNEK